MSRKTSFVTIGTAVAALAMTLALPVLALGLDAEAAINATAKAHTVTGVVSSVSGTTVTLTPQGTGNGQATAPITVDASHSTLVRNYGAAMTASDVQVGDHPQVKGAVSGSTLAATHIRDLSLQAHNGTFTGTITSVGSTNFVLQSKNRGPQTINVTTSTTIKVSEKTATFADLKTGQNARVTGVWDRTNSNVTATAVSVPSRTITGKVTAINGSTITVTSGSTVRTVDAASPKLYRRYGAAMAITDIQIGDELQIKGVVNDTTITTTSIRDLSLQTHNGTFVGTILSLGTNSFVLQSKARGQQTINLTSTTTIKRSGTTLTFADLKMNDEVRVTGVWDRTNKNVTASSVVITRDVAIVAARQSAESTYRVALLQARADLATCLAKAKTDKSTSEGKTCRTTFNTTISTITHSRLTALASLK